MNVLNKSVSASDDFSTVEDPIISSTVYYGFIRPDEDCKLKVIDLSENTKKKSRSDILIFNNVKYRIFAALYANKPSDIHSKAIIGQNYIPATIQIAQRKYGLQTIEILELLK